MSDAGCDRFNRTLAEVVSGLSGGRCRNVMLVP